MQHICQTQPRVFEYWCLHFSPQELADPQQIRFVIDRDLMLTGVRKRQFQDALVIMNFLGEAIDAAMAQPLADVLRELGARPAGIFMVPLTAANYPSATIPHWCANHSDWFNRFHRAYPNQFNFGTDRRVICLNRRHSPVRSQVVDHLLENFRQHEILLSHECLHTWPSMAKTRYLDGPVADRTQHRAPDQQWLRAAVKLITEGNEQHMLNVPETVLVSEKTFKCFAWRQFPVWVSVPGTVQAVRDMGFDVFDDLFDQHVYDTIPDQQQRITAALDLVTDFASRPMHQLRYLRHRYCPRLQNNYRRLRVLAHQRDHDLVNARNRFIKMFATNHDFRV